MSCHDELHVITEKGGRRAFPVNLRYMYIGTSFASHEIFNDFETKINLAGNRTVVIKPELVENGSEVKWFGEQEGLKITITEKHNAENNASVLYLDLVSDEILASDAAIMNVSLKSASKVLDFHRHNGGACWMMCGWESKEKGFEHLTDKLLIEKDLMNYSITCLTGDLFRFDMSGKENPVAQFRIGAELFKELHGPFLAIGTSSHPIDAVDNAYAFAHKTGAISVLMRDQREYPEMFEKFGWCSWNAFYQEPTSEKIYKKLDEFKEKNIPVHWVLIDDGWSPTEDLKLLSFKENREKFPEGFKECIRRIKEDYGVKQVGVWHTIHAYWAGIHPDSELFREHKDEIMFSRLFDRYIPINKIYEQFKFWDEWHEYLEECGVDFVKVDNQASDDVYIEQDSLVRGMRVSHAALELSVDKHFDGKIINCMGMDMANVLNRPHTAISRNSDDFYPDRENGFAMHLQQNVYNAIWHSQIYHCDYDMWWSGKADPVQSGLLRAISGGPIYISDAIGETDPEGIKPVVGEDGEIYRLDGYAKPTEDCIYRDCKGKNSIQKTFNFKKDMFALALFNISGERQISSFPLGVIPGIKKTEYYVAYEYFTKKFTRLRADYNIDVDLKPGDCRAYSIYPLHRDSEGEYILLGDCSRYIGIGAPKLEKKYFSQVNKLD